MSTFKDPFEEALLMDQTVEAKAAMEESSLGSPRRPHDAPPSIPSSAVPSPPSDADGGGRDDDEEKEERTEVQRDDFPSSDDSDEFARLRMIFKDPFEEAWLKDQAVEAAAVAKEALLGSPRRPYDAPPSIPSAVPPPPSAANGGGGDDDEEEEERTEVQHEDFPSSNYSDEYYAWRRTILSSFTKEQMSRYEAFRRSAIPKSEIKKILTRIIGVQQGNADIYIVVSALGKMFVGDLVETARVVMAERKDSGPIRPCHIRESYRRLKLEGKTFQHKALVHDFCALDLFIFPFSLTCGFLKECGASSDLEIQFPSLWLDCGYTVACRMIAMEWEAGIGVKWADSFRILLNRVHGIFNGLQIPIPGNYLYGPFKGMGTGAALVRKWEKGTGTGILKLSAFFAEKGVSRSNYQGPLIESEVFMLDECKGEVTKPTFSDTDSSSQEKSQESKHINTNDELKDVKS
ncbi:Transcription initiation factor TFIID subunit 11 [Carex littledalei]|uniref:Transcription initiation factor TFIID subunit 11 n=1 Tax=Carex littledalei TaxID=544730 RepID=A0A833QHM3_9POAL|nr:Transcription initiation factor TFIID subunit 11 [Carex littledalei]